MAPNSYRTALSRARGLGSAHNGVSRFIGERVTSIALVPLSLWAVYVGFRVGPLGYGAAVAFLQSPLNAVMAVLLLGVSAAHMAMGMQVIIEDYLHTTANKIAALLLNAALCWLFAALGIFAILKVALMGVGTH